MSNQILEAVNRPNTGKGFTRRLRAEGLVPAVMYGQGRPAVSFALSPRALRAAFQTPLGRNTPLTLKFAEGDRTVVLKDMQRDVVKDNVIHMDFIEVLPGEKVNVLVPLEFSGKSKGVFEGGLFEIKRRELLVACDPALIPAKITVDITNVGVGENIHVNDLSLPEGVKAAATTNFTICLVSEVEAAEEKGPAAAAAPAAAPAKGAAKAAAPAKDAKKK
jgi:large subunit ribosomal protein L25